MYAIGLKIKYENNKGETSEGKITGWNIHSFFDEIYIDNGDVIVDKQIIETIET